MSNTPRINLTRREIARWVGPENHHLIKVVEDLFNSSTTESPGNFEEASILAENADSKAVQAISELQRVSDMLKGANVLVWLSM